MVLVDLMSHKDMDGVIGLGGKPRSHEGIGLACGAIGTGDIMSNPVAEEAAVA